MRELLTHIRATELAYLAAAALFILSLHWMNSVQTGR